MTEMLNEDRKAKILNDFPQYPFPKYLGIKITHLEYSVPKLEMAIRNAITQGMEFIHGGAISALCDTAVGEVDVNKKDGTLIAKALVTYYIFRNY